MLLSFQGNRRVAFSFQPSKSVTGAVMPRKQFWSGFGWGALAGGMGFGIFAALRNRAAAKGFLGSTMDTMGDRQFAMSSPRAHEHTRRDLLEADGTLLEGIRGGEQKLDRRRIDADKSGVHSPTNPPSYRRQGAQSAGWDEAQANEVEIPQRATGTGGVGRERVSTGATASSEIAKRSGG
jgi:hypothetical protein